MSRRRPGLDRAWGLAGAVLFLLVLFAPPAGAHAVLVEISPAPDRTLDAAPREVRLTFDEAVTVTSDSIRLFDPSGERVDIDRARGEGVSVVAALPELDVDGSYTVAWKVVSADGHPLRGAHLFHLRKATLSEPVDAADGGGAGVSGRAFRAVGAILALGGAVLSLAASTSGRLREGRARLWSLRWVPVVAGTSLLFGGAVVSVGSTLSESLEAVLGTTSGRSAAVAVAVALVGLVVSVAPKLAPVEPGVAGALVAAVALQGHAVSLSPVPLSALATLLHVVAAVAWGAGLFWVEHRSRERPEALAADVARLSPWGVGAVLVLAASGAWLVLDRVPVGDLVSSGYGRLAMVKAALLLAAAALALVNRSSAGVDDVPVDRLRSRVRLEMVVLAAALVAGAVLAQVSPPGQGSVGPDAVGGLFAERRPFGEAQVELTLDPGERGVNEVHITALAPDGRLYSDADELVLELELPSEDVGPLTPELQRITAGHSMAYVRIPFAGDWRMTVTSRIDRFTEVSATFEVPIGD